MADIDKKFQKLIDNYEEHCRRIAKASVVDIHERPADKIARVKRIEKDYVTWFEYYFPNYARCPVRGPPSGCAGRFTTTT